MFDEPKEDPIERAADAAGRAKDKTDEFRMHAELAAVFEGCRKFDAQIISGLDIQIARDVQRGMARLEKAKSADSPVLPDDASATADSILTIPTNANLSTNDYHIHRRPGETMIIRWLIGDQVDQFYTRLQAHFDAGLNAHRDEQRTDNAWKQDTDANAYLAALDAIDLKMADRYLRPVIQKVGIRVLSTQSADEMNIAYLANYIMGVDAAEIVGQKSAPPEEPTERDLAWFFKLFSLRGMQEKTEVMCFFTFLQKSDDDFEF
jgi:hypothetical protein